MDLSRDWEQEVNGSLLAVSLMLSCLCCLLTWEWRAWSSEAWGGNRASWERALCLRYKGGFEHISRLPEQPSWVGVVGSVCQGMVCPRQAGESRLSFSN
jgi:hypothetical protein